MRRISPAPRKKENALAKVGAAVTAVAANAPRRPRLDIPIECVFVIVAYCVPSLVPSVKPTAGAHPQATFLCHDRFVEETVIHCKVKQFVKIGGILLKNRLFGVTHLPL